MLRVSSSVVARHMDVSGEGTVSVNTHRPGFAAPSFQGIPRHKFIERTSWRINRDDAFLTLPFSLSFILVFIVVVFTHLQIHARQQMERGLEGWMKGYGNDYPGPYLFEHVADRSQMWDWLVSSGASAVLGKCENTTTGTVCQVGPRNEFVGNLRIFQETDSVETSMWLLSSDEAKAHLTSNPGDILGAAVVKLGQLRNSGWLQRDSDTMGLAFTTYNRKTRMFAVTRAMATYDKFGFVVPSSVSRAIFVDPYHFQGVDRSVMYLLDAIYVLLVLYPIITELHEFCRGLLNAGWKEGCLSYWGHGGMEGFWNAIDIFGIVMGVGNIVQWIQLYVEVKTPMIQEFVGIGKGGMTLEECSDDAKLAMLETSLFQVLSLLQVLQWAMALNVVSVMMKLFKAFGANPRLQLVSNTLYKAAPDLLHFGLVFLAIFVGFALSGHILFGGDFVEFSHFPRSCNTAFQCLLGDFSWYTEFTISDSRLGSGLPGEFVNLWFMSYMTFVLLIMLNMLLAIIMDHYMALVEQLKASKDAPPLWQQVKRYYRQWRASSGFLPLYQILLEMKSTDVHPEDMVTQESLHRAFHHMNASQSHMIMSWLKNDLHAYDGATKRERTPEGPSELHRSIERISEHVNTLATHAEQVTPRLNAMEAKLAEIISRLPQPSAAEAGAVAGAEAGAEAGAVGRIEPSEGQKLPADFVEEVLARHSLSEIDGNEMRALCCSPSRRCTHNQAVDL
eukprot:CAMPEP_0170651734 /NCGR_PEP_ID=MMETSP0224-20130122/46525_1 /TAXON_ID=285029 /ORGANISM="Togula jolla, Strain CCCM 725" /LENGTH=729 /DNA_ID=CAMNT_0010983545 /DNA_START=45 /DNA_END=2234 /DNA_ORIENTATION=+